ncbi:biopolymer transporter ExbB [Shimia sp. R10_1]|uniref:biopolymer transporter ExbB n=1 Tax=Shimia sp. R10_1 TaxID=2821095 RepID=UPI001ADBD0F0|nr:biopolymer transporter ExbB [Shimia sp. R10_1]MBO9474478.1 biopolymer transporter ExbB [Shimia sp. R10_1]
MDQPDRKVEPHFSKPTLQILQMLVVLVCVAGVGYLALPSVLPVFQANPELNGFIILVFLFGVAATFAQVLSLFRSVRWIEGFAGLRDGYDPNSPPTLLVSLASLLRERGAHGQISSSSSRSILDSVATRVDEAREITRYVVNLLIFLGLLGTFYGLATTVPAVVDTIQSLNLTDGTAPLDAVGKMMEGLKSQLGGMGVAFASSLLGLAGSLVVGLLELLASHGQNRFYGQLEEWLSSITRVGFSSGEGDGGDIQVLGAAFEHMSGQLDQLRETMMATAQLRGEEGAMSGGEMGALIAAVERMADRVEAQTPANDVLLRLAEGQEALLAKLSEGGGLGEGGIDAESRMRLRSMDVQMLRILEEISAGRQESMAELRTELSGISRVLRRVAKAQEAEPATQSHKVQLKRPPISKGGQEG